MLLDSDIRGDDLPPKTVCLTYDDGPGESEGDGPGPHTTALGQFLVDRGVRATFFVIGRHAERYPETLRQLASWGHVIGNHTYSHPNLVQLAADGGDVVAEVALAHEAIKPFVSGGTVFLRPPYGSWRHEPRPDRPETAPSSRVAAVLNRSGQFAEYIGPIQWNIDTEDWRCWRQGMSPADCARRYLVAITAAGRGIVLMHDSSAEDDARPRNQTLRLTQLLVPALQASGFRFAGLDAVPQVQALRSARHANR